MEEVEKHFGDFRSEISSAEFRIPPGVEFIFSMRDSGHRVADAFCVMLKTPTSAAAVEGIGDDDDVMGMIPVFEAVDPVRGNLPALHPAWPSKAIFRLGRVNNVSIPMTRPSKPKVAGSGRV